MSAGMWSRIFDWFGFGAHGHYDGGHRQSHDHGPTAHTHGVIDATIATTDRGIWAIKWSFVILAITAMLQIGVVAIPSSGLLITIAIFGIVWQSARSVLTRMLDGVEPGLIDDIHHAAEHVAGIDKVVDAKARWIGHELHADVAIRIDGIMPLSAANKVAASLQGELFEHLPTLAVANIRFAGGDAGHDQSHSNDHPHDRGHKAHYDHG